VLFQHALDRLLRFDSSGCDLSRESQSDGSAAHAGPAALSASQDADLARTTSNDSLHSHRQSAEDWAAIEESKRELEVQIISSIAEQLGDAVAKAKLCEEALADSVAQATSVAQASANQVDNKSASAFQAKSSSSYVAAAPNPAREAVALSSKSAAEAEDDSAFDETKTPDAPILKYGRNGVPELRQVTHCHP
jgi:hypothetical protein